MKRKPDAAWKMLFSTREIVRDLITGFVADSWIRMLDLDTLEKVPTHFVDRRMRQRITDVVWRVRSREGDWTYLYLLIEFQSGNDHWMALRVMGYVALLWQDLLARDRELRRTRRLPPVLPVVIHSGASPWRAATDIAELLPALPDGLASYAPRMKYLLLDTHRFDDAGLRPMRNLLASVMRLELNPDAPTHLEAIADLRRLVSGAPELKRVFSDWLTALLADRPDLADSGAIDLQETDMGIRENIERWQKEAIAKGRMEGLVEGRVEGRVEGEALMLQRLLAKRFGPLPLSNVSPRPPRSRSRSGLIGCSMPDRSTRSSRTERRSSSNPHRRNA